MQFLLEATLLQLRSSDVRAIRITKRATPDLGTMCMAEVETAQGDWILVGNHPKEAVRQFEALLEEAAKSLPTPIPEDGGYTFLQFSI